MEAIAHARYQRYGRRKMGQVCGLIRGKTVKTAEDLLTQVARRSAPVVGKTLKSAASNLQIKAGRRLEGTQMWVRAAFSNQGPMKALKRIQPGPQGRAMPFKRKMCHVTIVVSDSQKKD